MLNYKIYTDGGYSKKKDIGAYAAVVVLQDAIIWQGSYIIQNATSNIAELQGMILAHKKAHELLQKYPKANIQILSDSQYCVKGYNEWSKEWKKDNYKNKPVMNKSLWLYLLKKKHPNITVKWIKAHAKDNSEDTKYNNIVDNLTRKYEWYNK